MFPAERYGSFFAKIRITTGASTISGEVFSRPRISKRFFVKLQMIQRIFFGVRRKLKMSNSDSKVGRDDLGPAIEQDKLKDLKNEIQNGYDSASRDGGVEWRYGSQKMLYRRVTI
jgi:hypothetical protein